MESLLLGHIVVYGIVSYRMSPWWLYQQNT